MQTPKGTRDLLPEKMIKLQRIIDILRKVFEKYGFQPLETPAFEDFNVLSKKGSGESLKDEIYYFEDKSGRSLGLRFDLTVPLARFLSNNPEIPKPFKRYQIGRVWRYDNPQKLRWREFWQADIDIVGTDSLLADVECLAASIECLKKLKFKDFSIRINNRKLIEFILTKSGIEKNKINEAFRIIDKLDKIGIRNVKKELKEKNINPEIVDILKISGSNKKILNKISKQFPCKGLNELKELLEISKKFKISKYLKIDLSMVRGLDYYTGTVFEIMIGKENVTFAAGGRYDNLIKTIGGPDLPATGISFGLDRILSLIKEKEEKKGIFVIPVNDSVRDKALEICLYLRKRKIIADTDLMKRNLSKLLKYASNNYKWVAIVGQKELKKESVKLRNMITGKEKTVKIKDIKKFI